MIGVEVAAPVRQERPGAQQRQMQEHTNRNSVPLTHDQRQLPHLAQLIRQRHRLPLVRCHPVSLHNEVVLLSRGNVDQFQCLMKLHQQSTQKKDTVQCGSILRGPCLVRLDYTAAPTQRGRQDFPKARAAAVVAVVAQHVIAVITNSGTLNRR